MTETNRAAGLSVLYCGTSSVHLSVVSGTAVRGVANSGEVTNLGQGSFVTNSLSPPGGVGDTSAMSVSATTTSAAGAGAESGLSKGGMAGTTIGTVAVISFIVFGAGFLVLRNKKLEAKAKATTPHTASVDNQLASDNPDENVRADIPRWPVEVDGDHELRHWTPHELDGGEMVGNKEEPEAEGESTVVSPVEDGDESRDSEQRKIQSSR